MDSLLDSRTFKLIIIIPLLLIVLVGILTETVTSINKTLYGIITNDQLEILTSVKVVVSGKYDKETEKFYGSININDIELKNIIAERNKVLYTMLYDDGYDRFLGKSFFTDTFSSIDFLVNDKEVIERILGSNSDYEEIRIIAHETIEVHESAQYSNEKYGFELYIPEKVLSSEFFEVRENNDKYNGATSLEFIMGEVSEEKIYSGGIVFEIIISDNSNLHNDAKFLLENNGDCYFYDS